MPISLSLFEKTIIGILLTVAVGSGTYILYNKNKNVLIEVPKQGGKYTEGIIGTPRFVNPLLAISNADKDLTSIVYAGLMTRDEDGKIIPELAKEYSISEDGTVYTFTLRDNLTFHDGTPLTADDVVFTVKQAGNPTIRSPHFANWDGVQVEKKDDKTIVFTLPKPYAPFIENMTIGILPSHIWKNLSSEEFPFSQFNITPVGAGPFMISSVNRDKSGIPISYELKKFKNYSLGEPYINNITFKLFNNNKDALSAFKSNKIDTISGISPNSLEEFLNTNPNMDISVHRIPVLRIFSIFFNHNKQPLFLKDEVRMALKEATPEKAIVGEILHGYGTTLDSPLIPGIFNDANATATVKNMEDDEKEKNSTSTDKEKASINHIEKAKKILENKGWKKGDDGIYVLKKGDKETRLSFAFSTVNIPEMSQTAEKITSSWKELGAEVELKMFEPSDLTQMVIRPRKFDALLFGMVIGHEMDFYAFWHSSQRNDPGLNIAQYADIEADALLEKMRTEQNPEKRTALYKEFSDLIKKQDVAIFLYSPDFIYLTKNNIHNISLHALSEQSERFDTVHTWYMKTDNVWPVMQKFFK